MARIFVPYHLDEYRPGLDVPVQPDITITADLPDGNAWQRMAALYQRVAGVVADDVRAGQVPTVLSGDCTTALATVAGMQRAGLDPAIVWFDGHGDVQTLETTTSGYIGGFPLRILVGYRPDLISDAIGLRAVPEERTMLVDARDLDPPEIEFLHNSKIIRRGVYDLAHDDGTAAGIPDGPVYLHLDLDVIDPSELPEALFPAPGGPGMDAVFAAVRRVMETGRVAAVGAGCTWRPGHGAAHRIGTRLAEAIAP